MARLAGIKIKKKKARLPSERVRKNLLQDPSWEGADGWSGKEYHNKRQAATSYYYQNYKGADLVDFVYHWMLDNEFTKYDIKCAKAAKSTQLNQVTGYYARMLTMGCPDEHLAWNAYWESLPGTGGTPRPISEYIKGRISQAIEEGKVHVDEAEKRAELEAKLSNRPKPTIQQLLHTAAIQMTDEIEDFLDSWVNSKYDVAMVKDFTPDAMLRKAGAKQAHSRIIRKVYEASVAEFAELATKVAKDDKDDMRLQLEEGYEHMSKAQQKAGLEIYRKITNACDIVEAESKVNRKPRKVRIKSPEDLVKKLKFKQSDAEYGLGSITPADIIYARVLVVFNTRNRKVGTYYASNVDPMGLQREGSGLSVKGTTITGYDEEKSLQRTIRKPAEVLPELKKTTRAKTEKLIQSLKTTETKLNGRINGETILIAAFNK
tara:strand:- start:53 stop:1348 length:1296 start_codon:yes stop_codon:yes gene_type:complete